MSAQVRRQPAVAGSFYPSEAGRLRELAAALLEAASQLPHPAADALPALPAGLLVPHAGLVYSGVTAAAAWRTLADAPDTAARSGTAEADAQPVTVVFLGTNHMHRRLDGIAVWDGGAWEMPTGAVGVNRALAAEIAALGLPFAVDLASHAGEHSIEVQLPLLTAVAPRALIVPLAVSAGTGDEAMDAGEALGRLLADRRDEGARILLAVSTDMAHYPPAAACERATNQLLPLILATDGVALAAQERALVSAANDSLACGMCGIEPAVMGMAAFRAMDATRATVLAASTSADAGGDADRAVGYLAVRFDTPVY
jgi:AmmeMemoRadiSam system protein B